MVSRLLYCTRADCRRGLAVVGAVPRMCPACERPTRWTRHAPEGRPAADPVTPFSVTHNDYWLFLRRVKISPT